MSLHPNSVVTCTLLNINGEIIFIKQLLLANGLTSRKAGLKNFQHSLQYRPGLKPIMCSISSLNLSTPGEEKNTELHSTPDALAGSLATRHFWQK